VSVILHQGSGAGDFSLDALTAANHFTQYRRNISDLLSARGQHHALELFQRFPWELREASNFFGDDFSVLHATVPLKLYEEARQLAAVTAEKLTSRQIADTVTELGAYVRFIAVDLDASRRNEPPSDPKALKLAEINKLVYKYIGVEGGYLGDFSYQKHHDFYVDLELDIDPHKYEGTTRQRFIAILTEASPDVQARILQGILDRYMVGSNPTRTQALSDEIVGWIRRLATGAAVAPPSLKVTSAVVERALNDDEKLMGTTGAPSGVDRVHTALHGYLIQVCADASIPMGAEPSLTQLFKLLRTRHPAFQDLGPRADDMGRVLNSLASVVDVLNPVRNKASVAHPNASLLPDPEAMLIINSVKTMLHYFDSKLHAAKGKP
jgi:Abortive infection C-terminus